MTTSTVDLRPAKLNVKMVRGDTAAPPILIQENGSAADLTGRTFAAQIRRSASSATAIDIDVDTTEAADGILVLRIDEETTETLTGEYVWDLQQTIGDTVRTLLSGRWTFDADVTRLEA
jgi:hypothetical protein